MGFWKKLFGGKKNPHSNISQRGESVRRNIYETVSIAPADQVRLIELEAEIRKMAEPEVDVRRHKEFAAAACHRASQDIASLMAWPVEFGTTGLVDFAGLTKMIADLERFRHLPFKFPFEERIKKLKEMMAILQKYRREPDIVQSEAAVPSVTGIHEATPITPAEKTRLAQLEAEIQKMAEPKLNGIETKEYYAHMGAQVLAGMMTVMSGDDVELTDHDFTDLTKRVADIERQDLKGSTFKFPWPERIKRLKEMNAIVQRKRGQPRIAQSEEQQPAAFETQNPQQHDKVKPTTPARNTGRAAEISLHRAAGAGDFNAINHSITNGAGVDEIDEMGLTPLTWAAGQGHVKAAAALIANGANINAVDPNKLTPLLLAVARGHIDVARLLLEKGADANAQTVEGCSALFFAKTKSIAELLISHGAYVRARARDGSTPLICTAKDNRRDVAEILISNGADLNSKDGNGLTALLSATMSSAYDTVSLLIANKANIGAKDKNGITALHVAAHKGERGLVGLLLAAGADRSAQANDGSVPAELAFKAGHIEIANVISSNRVTKRTFSVPGVPDLVPSDVKLGSPNTAGSAQKGEGWFHIETPEGAYICVQHHSKRGAELCVEELQKHLRSHTVNSNAASINEMLAQVDRLVVQRMNNST